MSGLRTGARAGAGAWAPGVRGRAGAADPWLPAILVMLAAVCGLAAWIYTLRDQVERAKTVELAKAEKELREMLALPKEIAALRRNLPAGPKKGDGQQTIISMLQAEVTRVGLNPATNIGTIQPQPESKLKDGWVEHAYKVPLKDANREQVAHLLYNMEIQPPFLKARNIDIKFDEFHRAKDAAITIVYYTR